MIHLVGVPLIIWTMLLYGTYLPFTFNITAPTAATPRESRSLPLPPTPHYVPKILQLPPQHRLTWATLWVLLYVIFYIYIDFVGACLYTPFLYTMYVTSVHWSTNDLQQQQQQPAISNKWKDDSVDPPTRPYTYHWYGTGNLLFQAFWIHISSWYIQIHWGHGVLEGATPASLVNLGAALTSAPLFAFYELIWYLGYRTQLQQQVLQQVAIFTERLCTAGANLRVCTVSSI